MYSSFAAQSHALAFCGVSDVKFYRITTDNLQQDDELETPVLRGFEWDKEESWTRLIVHCQKEGAPPPSKKAEKKAKKKDGEE